jgi:hypothetical protein
VVAAEPTVAYTNTLVLRFCIPCLQIWLLAVKTDMQQAENWRWVFLLYQNGVCTISSPWIAPVLTPAAGVLRTAATLPGAFLHSFVCSCLCGILLAAFVQ